MEQIIPESLASLTAEISALKAELAIKDLLIANLEKTIDKISDIASKDFLTELPNQRTFQERLVGELDRVHRGGQSLALIMIDLDHFKKVNDTYGHPQGDQVLIELANILRENIRQYDTAARKGGEEFAIIMPLNEEFTLEDINQVLERYRQAAQKINRSGDDSRTDPLSISLGCVILKKGTSATPAELIQQADQNLYHSKRSGRDRYTTTLFAQSQ